MTNEIDNPNNEAQKAKAPDDLDSSLKKNDDSGENQALSGATEREKLNPHPDQQQELEINQGADTDAENQPNSSEPDKPASVINQQEEQRSSESDVQTSDSDLGNPVESFSTRSEGNPDSPDQQQELKINQGADTDAENQPNADESKKTEGEKETASGINQESEENTKSPPTPEYDTKEQEDSSVTRDGSEESGKSTSNDSFQKYQDNPESKKAGFDSIKPPKSTETASDLDTVEISSQTSDKISESSQSEGRQPPNQDDTLEGSGVEKTPVTSPDAKETTDYEVAKLKERVSALEKQLEEVAKLKEQVSTQQKEIDTLKEQLSQMENRPYPGKKIVEAALKEDQKQLKKDEEEFNTYRQEFQQLQKGGNELQESIKSVVEDCQKKISDHQPRTVPELEQKLQQRQEALDLIAKMLGRLPEQTNLFVKDETIPEELPKITEPELIEIVNANTENEAELAINKKLKQVGNERWQIVSESRKLVAGYHKRLFNFVKMKVLPILDGIDDGEKYSKELKTECADVPNILDSLLQLHDDLRQIVIEMLKLVKISPIEVQIGTPIDYNCQEPFDTQPDATWENEVIKDVTRKGYKYQLEESQEWQVLRPAQVIVVKNN